MSIKVLIKRTDPRAAIPTKPYKNDAAYDLSVLDDVEVRGRETALVPTGLSVSIPPGYVGKVYERSSFNKRFDCSLTNKVGIVDSGYSGELFLSIRNEAQTTRCIPAGARVAQLSIEKVEEVEFEEVDELPATARGAGGFGSTN